MLILIRSRTQGLALRTSAEHDGFCSLLGQEQEFTKIPSSFSIRNLKVGDDRCVFLCDTDEVADEQMDHR